MLNLKAIYFCNTMVNVVGALGIGTGAKEEGAIGGVVAEGLTLFSSR